MAGKRIIIFILAAFIGGTLLLIYIEYNSNKNTNNLIEGNKKLLAEFKVSNELKELAKDVFTIENKVRGIVTTEDTVQINVLESEIAAIDKNLSQLGKISDDDSSGIFVRQLNVLIYKKISFSNLVLDTYFSQGKAAAENVIRRQPGNLLTDSITEIINQLDNTRKKHLAIVTRSIEKSGVAAERFSILLMILVVIGSALFFWYISGTIRRQALLIHQLNVSKTKERATAQVKENFLANMSHEIRTPMNAVIGYTRLLGRKDMDEEARRYVNHINKSGENLLAIINDILDLSKIEAGMMRIENAPFHLRELVHDVVNMFEEKIDPSKITMTYYIDEKLPEYLTGDATRLFQVLGNVMSNAVKFTQVGEINLDAKVHAWDNENVIIDFTIRDTGEGIDKDKQELIFQRFQQAEDSVSRRHGGTGLGLAIVKDLVSLLNGTISLESMKGAGSAFLIRIPFTFEAKGMTLPLQKQNPEFYAAQFAGIKILVAEDNEINQELISHLLKNWSAEPFVVKDGGRVIEALKKESFDLVLMDIQMPEMDGYSTISIIREELKSAIPVIAMTAHVLPGEKEKCLGFGMNDYLPKPIDEERLQEIIRLYTYSKISPVEIQNVFQENILPGFITINLAYLREISGGDKAYEKLIAERFLEVLPRDLKHLETLAIDKQYKQVKALTHNLRSTISVFGLDEILIPYLDVIEAGTGEQEDFYPAFRAMSGICTAALAEVKDFCFTLS
ncbi:MAG: ATP-binding protein [Ferruginibacter sp.]